MKKLIVSGNCPKLNGNGFLARLSYHNSQMGMTRWRKHATRMEPEVAAKIAASYVAAGYANVKAE